MEIEGTYTEFIHSESLYLGSKRYYKDKIYWENKYFDCLEKSLIKLHSVLEESVAARRMTKVISFDLKKQIVSYCKENSVTQAVLFETAVIIYLSKINLNDTPITIGIPVLNRSNFKEKNAAGMFISTMPLTITMNDTMSVLDLEKKIGKENWKRAYEYISASEISLF